MCVYVLLVVTLQSFERVDSDGSIDVLLGKSLEIVAECQTDLIVLVYAVDDSEGEGPYQLITAIYWHNNLPLQAVLFDSIV
jgi:uncharacterized protein YuzB (UPF0349 family)